MVLDENDAASPGEAFPACIYPFRGWDTVSGVGGGQKGGTYSKSVCSLSSVMGWKTRLRLRMPSRQAESAVLAKIRPVRGGRERAQRFGPSRRGEHPPKSAGEPFALRYRSTRAHWERAGGLLLAVVLPPAMAVGKGRGFWKEGRETPAPVRHSPCREHSLIFPVIQATALAPILVPKFLSKGVGVPPCTREVIG